MGLEQLANILAQLEAAATSNEREWLALAFNLASLNPALQQAVWAAAIPHWFDGDYLWALVGPELSDNSTWGDWAHLLDRLSALPYIELFPGRGYNLHERSRALLLERLWRDDPMRFRRFSRRAVAYCARRDLEDWEWRCEEVYHMLVAEPERGAEALADTGWQWQNSPLFAYGRVETLVIWASEHLYGGRLDDHGIGWTLFWDARLDTIYSRYLRAQAKLEHIIFDAKRFPRLAANCFHAQGEVYFHLQKPIQAAKSLEKAFAFYQTLGDRFGEAQCEKLLSELRAKVAKQNELGLTRRIPSGFWPGHSFTFIYSQAASC